MRLETSEIQAFSSAAARAIGKADRAWLAEIGCSIALCLDVSRLQLFDADTTRRAIRNEPYASPALVSLRLPHPRPTDAKEHFSLIGHGVSDNPIRHVHIPQAQGFNIGGVRQPPRCLNSQQSQETAAAFIVYNARWRLIFSMNGGEGQAVMEEGDVSSIPTRMFGGFENISEETGFLFAMLGLDNPGKVTWAPRIFDLAKPYGIRPIYRSPRLAG